MGGFNFQRPESSQLSICFCPAVLRQISHCWEDSTHTHKLSCTCNMLQPERFFSPSPAAEGLWTVFSQICHSQHCLCTFSPRAPAVPGWLALGRAVSCGPSVQKAAWTPCVGSGSAPCAERAKSFTQSLSQPPGMELVGLTQNLSVEP